MPRLLNKHQKSAQEIQLMPLKALFYILPIIPDRWTGPPQDFMDKLLRSVWGPEEALPQITSQ
ncbi:hypothetical protein SAY86_012317 [Trapa natans]|uniref:Uncharacterized protein n=1 Tax=Trapa natans TaxID=22666 RepID=A0AAN7LRY5_TRANT|nr:hypothetical protein SAY86_012317 [Trapa natans]